MCAVCVCVRVLNAMPKATLTGCTSLMLIPPPGTAPTEEQAIVQSQDHMLDGGCGKEAQSLYWSPSQE